MRAARARFVREAGENYLAVIEEEAKVKIGWLPERVNEEFGDAFKWVFAGDDGAMWTSDEYAPRLLPGVRRRVDDTTGRVTYVFMPSDEDRGAIWELRVQTHVPHLMSAWRRVILFDWQRSSYAVAFRYLRVLYLVFAGAYDEREDWPFEADRGRAFVAINEMPGDTFEAMRARLGFMNSRYWHWGGLGEELLGAEKLKTLMESMRWKAELLDKLGYDEALTLYGFHVEFKKGGLMLFPQETVDEFVDFMKAVTESEAIEPLLF